MKSYNHKCIKVLFINEGQSFLFSISLTALSAALQDVVSVTVSTIQYSNAYHSI